LIIAQDKRDDSEFRLSFFLIFMKFAKVIFFISFLALSPTSFLAQTKFDRKRTFDVQNYSIKTKFDEKNRTVFGDTMVTLKPLKSAFNLLELDAEDLAFTSVKLADSKDLTFTTKEDKVFVNLDRDYAADELIAVRFVYSAKPKKGIYFVDEGKHRGNLHSSQIWTQGEPEEARCWFPSYDFPDDKATFEQFITAQKGETVISNGELIEKTENPDSTTTWHYKTNFVHSTYLASFVIGKYLKIEDKYRDIPLGFYLYPSETKIYDKAFSSTKDIFKTYEDLLKVDFPFNKYDQTIVAEFRFGGMENVTATTLSDTEVYLAEFDFGKDQTIDLVSHELAHSWFGDLVTCKNWAELWLNEGFATFMEAAYRERTVGKKDYLRKINDDARQYFGYESSAGSKRGLYNELAKPDDSILDEVTYQKGSVVLHMLRNEVGDEIFWKSVNFYLNRHRFGNVESKDLKAAFEEVSGKNLDLFFTQWVYGKGYPNFVVKQSYSRSAKTLRLDFLQKQLEFPIFNINLDLNIKTAKGMRTEKLRLDKKTDSIRIPIDVEPISLEFDPDQKIPLKRMDVGKLKITK
jgi:aminopeptidase N